MGKKKNNLKERKMPGIIIKTKLHDLRLIAKLREKENSV